MSNMPDDKWKARYSKLYSRSSTSSNPTEPKRMSFMGDEYTPAALLRLQRIPNESTTTPADYSTTAVDNKAPISPQLAELETRLLSLVRASAEPTHAPTDDRHEEDSDDEILADTCTHGQSMRYTDRSMSRSRISRLSMKRDMDIPSILAYSASQVAAPVHLELPEFQNLKSRPAEQPLRWSVRRAACPVCSQKWKDRSAISIVKGSGLKRNFLNDSPSVIVPARLRTSIELGYVPRPAQASLDEEAGVTRGSFRSTGAAWQLTRARRFRAPRPASPPPGAPPAAAAPLAQKDLDTRLLRFLETKDTNAAMIR